MKPLERRTLLVSVLLSVILASLAHADGGAGTGETGGAPLTPDLVGNITASVGGFFAADAPNLSDLGVLSALKGADLDASSNRKMLKPLLDEVQAEASALTREEKKEAAPDAAAPTQQQLLSKTMKLRALKDLLGPFLADQKQENLVGRKYEEFRLRMDNRHAALLTQMGSSLRLLARDSDLLNAPRVVVDRRRGARKDRLAKTVRRRVVLYEDIDGPAPGAGIRNGEVSADAVKIGEAGPSAEAPQGTGRAGFVTTWFLQRSVPSVTPPSEIDRLLLDFGADIDGKNAFGMTPLMYAAQYGEADRVGFLIFRGARLGLKNKQGQTAADLARKHYPQIAAMIEDAARGRRASGTRASNADGPRGNAGGAVRRALSVWFLQRSVPSLAGGSEIDHYLLDYGADINAQNVHGMTPLMYAAEMGDRDRIRLLLDRGADPFIKNDDGLTAGDLAEKNDHGSVASKIRDEERDLKRFPHKQTFSVKHDSFQNNLGAMIIIGAGFALFILALMYGNPVQRF